MQKFNKFYFKSFEFDIEKLEAKFHYCFDNETFFEEKINFPLNFKTRENLDINIINNMLFHVHIALWISYYKLYPTNDLVLESGCLDETQISFWKKFYTNWLGEFFYTNKISLKWLFNFVNNTDKKYSIIPPLTRRRSGGGKSREKSLVALGWWKDSIVSMELLEKSGCEYDLVVFWKSDGLKENVAKKAEKEILLITRQLSDKLFELNKNWYYNGHVPITWIIAFILELTSYIYDYKYIVLSNERSANFGNTNWQWLEINHQYSKSLEFEKDFEKYVEKHISQDIKYFSLLRWMYETKIAELFSELWKKYFEVFSSCNWNFKILSNYNNTKHQKIWCNDCPKCAFVFTILRPHLTKKEVLDIFWEDLFEKKSLELIFRELLWISWIKPFECVWEIEEVIYSMYKSLDFYESEKNPFILEIFKKEVLEKQKPEDIKKIENKLVTIYNDDIIPEKIKQIIFKQKN